MQKKCLILGGGSDIGRAIVAEFARKDHEVFWTYWNTRVEQPGTVISCDLRDTEQTREMLEMVGGGIDLLVTSSMPFLESDNLDFEGYVAIEPFLRAHVYVFTRMRDLMNHDGRIVNMLGQCVERGLPGGAFYSAVFAFLHNLGNSINGREGKMKRLSVCDILLGPVDTREWSGLSDEVITRYRSRVAQFLSPEQVAQTVRFIAESEVMPSIFKLDAYYGY